MNVDNIAKVCHEVNRAYAISTKDNSQKIWEESPQWLKDSAINGVKSIIANPDISSKELHELWMNEKKKQGWIYGAVKDEKKKEHPAYLPYDRLPQEQKVKDYLFGATVRSLLPHLGDSEPTVKVETVEVTRELTDEELADKVRKHVAANPQPLTEAEITRIVNDPAYDKLRIVKPAPIEVRADQVVKPQLPNTPISRVTDDGKLLTDLSHMRMEPLK